jgi:XTP/dITP diphosphohydrolase
VTALVLATRSDDKAREIDQILGAVGIQLLTLHDLDVAPDPAEEDIEGFDTFRANAVAKARWFAERLGRVAVADDSGLRVDALDGRPGVRTKRFSGRDDLAGSALDQANNERLLLELDGVPESGRGASYVCCAAVAWPDGRALAALGSVGGRIADSQRGGGGFGYDPLFYVPDLGARFSEVPAVAKNAISHRARAFRALGQMLARPPWPLAAHLVHPGPARREAVPESTSAP